MSAPIYWSFARASQDKRTIRSAVPPLGTHELVGIDGREEGAIRRFPGFEEHLTLQGNPSQTYTQADAIDQDGSPNASAPSDVLSAVLNDCFPFTMNVDADTKAWGFVYRYTTPTNVSRIFMDYRVSGDASYTSVDLTGWISDAGDQIDLQEFGTFLFVGIKGSRLIRITFDESNNLTATSDTGPGGQPALAFGERTGVQAIEDLQGASGALAPYAVPTGDEPATAFVHFVGLTGRTSAVRHTDPDNAGVEGDGGTEGVFTENGSPINEWTDFEAWDGTSNVDVFTIPPQTFPSFTTRTTRYPNNDVRGRAPGAAWDIASRQIDDPSPLIKSSYSFAYQLYDSRTGLRSQVSPIIASEPSDDFAYNASIGGTTLTPDFRSATKSDSSDASGFYLSQWASVTFPCIDITYDSSKFDTLLVYRSIANQGAATLNSQFKLLSLDKTVTLSDFHVDSGLQPDNTLSADTKWRRAIYFLRLTDPELGVQEPLRPEFDYEPDAPKAGALGNHEGVMFYGAVGDFTADSGGQGIYRYSSPYSVSPELVSVFNRGVLDLPNEEIIDWKTVGSNVFGLSEYQVYLVRKEGLSVRSYPQHNGFGLVNNKASEVVASELYYITNQGLKKLTVNGDLYDIAFIDQLINDDWADDLSVMQLALDPQLKCLFIHNPNKDRAVCVWLNKAIISELHYIDFVDVRRGPIPLVDNSSPQFEERAVFVRTVPAASGVGIESVVFKVSSDQNLGRMFDLGGDPNVLTVDGSNWVADTATEIRVGLTATLGSEPARNLVGHYVTFLDGPLVGSTHQITSTSSFGNTLVLSVPSYDGSQLDSSTQYAVSIAPVHTCWTGAPVGLRQDGPEYAPQIPDSFNQKVVTGISLHFSDVNETSSSQTSDNLYRYRAAIRRGNSDSLIGPLLATGADGAERRSIEDEASVITTPVGTENEGDGVSGTLLAPYFDIFVGGIDFRILGARVISSNIGGRRSFNSTVGDA